MNLARFQRWYAFASVALLWLLLTLVEATISRWFIPEMLLTLFFMVVLLRVLHYLLPESSSVWCNAGRGAKVILLLNLTTLPLAMLFVVHEFRIRLFILALLIVLTLVALLLVAWLSVVFDDDEPQARLFNPSEPQGRTAIIE